MRLPKAWTVIEKLSIIWKSNLSDKIKRIFPSSGRVNSIIWMHHRDSVQTYCEETLRELLKKDTIYIEQILEATSYETAVLQPLISYLWTIQIRRTKYEDYCWKSKDGHIKEFLQWTPSHGHASVGRLTRTYQ